MGEETKSVLSFLQNDTGMLECVCVCVCVCEGGEDDDEEEDYAYDTTVYVHCWFMNEREKDTHYVRGRALKWRTHGETEVCVS